MWSLTYCLFQIEFVQFKRSKQCHAQQKRKASIRYPIHKNRRYMYAATHPYTVDENGNRKYVYCHWGVVGENKKFIPGKRYVFANLEERAKLIFLDDWDMSEAKRLSGAKLSGRKKARPADCGAQIDIANALGFKISDGCTPKYTSRTEEGLTSSWPPS